MIEKLRPLFDLDSPLRLIPREWLRDIEPKIKRVGTCWMWQGAHGKDGEPVISLINVKTGKRNTRLVKRIVAAMFYEIKRHYDIFHHCGMLSCLNPSHITVSAAHYTQENREKIVKAKRKNIDDYEQRGR